MPQPPDPPVPAGGYHVVRLVVENFKRLRAARLGQIPDRGLVLVRGRNAHGKSSLIESMLATFLGARGAKRAGRLEVDQPIRDDEHHAETLVDLGGLVVRKRWSRGAGPDDLNVALTIEDPDGTRRRAPQKLLDDLVGRFADPLAFLAQKPEEQVRTVLGVLGLDEELDRLEADRDGHYERRRDRGRVVERLSRTVETLSAEVEALPAPPAGESASALAERLRAGEEHNRAREAASAAVKETARRGADLALRVEELETRLRIAREEHAAAKREWAERVEAHNALAPEVDLQPFREALYAHEEAARHAGRRELLDQNRAELQQAREAHGEAEADLEAARESVRALLAGATFPVEGMAYEPETKTLTLGGHPFGQASSAERLRAAAAVAMAGDPQIRVLFARDGSLLDAEGKATLAALAEERGWQFFLEVVDDEAEGSGIWVEDGEARLSEPEA